MGTFSKAIVRRPCRKITDGITSADLGLPDYEKAVAQHNRYVESLTGCGLEVDILEEDEDYPDSVFVEDPALLTEKVAILTRPGADSRRGEAGKMADQLSIRFDNVEKIISPGTIEGGDILRVNDHFYIGLSARTNREGANQMGRILTKHGFTTEFIELTHFLHLKTGVSFLGNNTLVLSGELTECSSFARFNKIIVPDNEEYAANCLSINNHILLPEGYPVTRGSIERMGFSITELDMSEFRKIDGGLSCLSLRY